MQINIGGLWERPIAIADERPILSPVYSEINISESAESTTFRCYSKEFYINGEGHDVTDFIHFKSICPEEWDEAETNLHSNAVNSSGTFHENNLKACFADMDVEQFSLKVQSNNHFENSSDQESMRDIGLSTDQKGTKNDVRADLGMSALCAHASKALKVRSSTTKDRHCKVNTPKGHRDRRVRLAVPTAVQLYNLQDRLGLHQPSKVLDWLMSKAKPAIDELPRPSSISNFNCPSCNTSVQNNGSTVVVVPTSRRAGRKSHSVAKILPFSTQKTENKIGSRNGEDLKVSATNVVHFPVLQNRAQASTPVKISSTRKRRQPSVLSKKENTQLEVIPMTSPFRKQSGCFEIGFNCPENINSFLAPFNPKGAPLSSWETQVGTDPQRLLTGNYLPFVVYSSESHSDLSQRHAGETSYVSEKCTRPLLSYSQDNGCIYVEEALRLSGHMNSYSDTGVPKLTPNPLCESIASSSTTDSTDGTEVHANGGGN